MPSRHPTMKVAAPVLPVGDIARAADLYRDLGFTVERYAGADPYAFAQRDDAHLHLAQAANIDALSSMVSVYLYVDVAAACTRSGARRICQEHLHRAEPTAYGLLEGAYVDPDGNLLPLWVALARRWRVRGRMMPSDAFDPPYDKFLETAAAVTRERSDVDPAMAREVFEEVATLLYNGLALDGLDEHDTAAVVDGLCVDLIAEGPRCCHTSALECGLGGPR